MVRRDLGVAREPVQRLLDASQHRSRRAARCAATPYQALTSKSASPASISVGTPGSALLRWRVVTARAFTPPPWIWPSTEGRFSNIRSTSPAIRPVTACAAPR
jgi:hypothetical protein